MKLESTRAYRTWCSIKQRCLNPKRHNFKHYGGRGIKICERWLDFQTFLTDMGNPPHGKTIERINNDGDYEPSNCRWATQMEQMNNTRKSRFIEHNGERRTISEWAKLYNLDHSLLSWRLRKNWPVARLFVRPNYFRINPEDVSGTIDLIKTGLSQRQIAKRIGIDPQTVKKIRILNNL